MSRTIRLWMDQREASQPPAKFAISPNNVLIARTVWYVVALSRAVPISIG
jgi:hypothetical protein